MDKNPAPLKILVVDDDEALLETVVDLLTVKGGCEVRMAKNANEALTMLPSFTPQLSLIDIRMPGMNGWELVKLIRQRTTEHKIIMLTGSYAENDIRAAFASGVDGYLLKPVRAALLYRLIDNVINNVPLEQQFTSTNWTSE
ncbi:MAG: response regulator [Neisseriaceae bacterium]|nr:MAG: response regulator [Neisseriaceae bacterium]